MLKDQSEARLQIASANYLRGIIRQGKTVIKVQKPFPELIFAHVANEVVDEKSAFWNQIKGILPGMPDWLFFWLGNFGAIELKTNSVLSPNQKDFSIKFQGAGGKYSVCKSVAQVRDTLIGWGLKCYNEHAIEPKPSQKQQMAFYNELCRSDYD